MEEKARRAVSRLQFTRPWTIAQAVEEISAKGGKPIKLRPVSGEKIIDDFGPEVSSVCISWKLEYIIVYSNDTPVPLQEVSIGHELGHIVFGHFSKSDTSMLFKCGFHDDHEREAEWFATHLMARADDYRTELLPSSITGRKRRILTKFVKDLGWSM
ncbi:ImmA/IrrE family metallo-endopeptidase [Nocardia sp. NPDC051052]|uniref:ImmA/IrrE family metallo-endopeptidase n=1 Tax=Nocardia sp. NPDC051052 TaxID=3364322 RepID=UPI0037AC64FF